MEKELEKALKESENKMYREYNNIEIMKKTPFLFPNYE